MPTYNCGPYIAEALDSALAQDYRPMEIIVADDGSTDDTAEVLAGYGQKIQVIRGDHRGVGAARNKILAVARGQFIAPLDADDIWLPGKISRQVETLLQNPQVSFCHSGCEMFGDERGDGPITEDRRRKIDGSCFEAQFRQTGVMPSTVLLRRADLPPRGFPEDMPNGEDYCLFLMMLGDHRAHYWPQLTTRIRRRRGQATGDRGVRMQVYNGLARLRALDYLRGRLDPELERKLRTWALDEMETCAYSRYWKGDYEIAARAFGWLGDYGREVPRRHRVKVTLERVMHLVKHRPAGWLWQPSPAPAT
jgi:glycosyltransferase involved in cell wall biosynthesis